MKHRQFQEWLWLSLYEELKAEEHVQLEKHLAVCSECSAEARKLKKLHASMSVYRPPVPTEKLLQQARMELRDALRTERSKVSRWDVVRSAIDAVLSPGIRTAAGSFALVAAGMLVGFLVFRTPFPGRNGNLQTLGSGNGDATLNRGDIQVMNVKFLSRDASSGEIEFTFDALTPVHIKGNVSDERVQGMLARALVNEQNPGVRLRAVGAILDRPGAPTDEVKKALIATVKYDDNRGVRKEALAALQKYLPDPEATDAILFVLKMEKNTGMKILAINSLDLAKYQGSPDREALVNVLREHARTDDNNYIRIRARAALQEATQQ